MARVLGVFPLPLPHRLRQTEVREQMERWLPPGAPGRERLLQACERSGVRVRQSLLAIDDVRRSGSFTDRNRRYSEAMIELGTAAVSNALEGGGWRPERIHTLISVSCTGVMIPPPDVHIMEKLGLSPSVRRIPMTELGCVAGAVALSRAAEIADAHAGSRGALSRGDLVVILSAELSSLSFQADDSSPANVISSSIFGDGIVAVVVGPDSIDEEPAIPGGWLPPRIRGSLAHVVPGTSELLGFDLRSSGFHIVLKSQVPSLLGEVLPSLVGGFLADLGWKVPDIARWIIHPGGEKVIASVLGAFGLSPEKGEDSRAILEEWGNPSSAGVLLVLERSGRRASRGERGLLLGFGPGLSIEIIALEW